MSEMFASTSIDVLDLSSFVLNENVSLKGMFNDNSVTGIPDTLIIAVK